MYIKISPFCFDTHKTVHVHDVTYSALQSIFFCRPKQKVPPSSTTIAPSKVVAAGHEGPAANLTSVKGVATTTSNATTTEAVTVKSATETVFYDLDNRHNGPATQIVSEFVKKNDTCAECTQSPVSWISTSLGCSLCEECATA